jgi:hypothetical protein
MEGHLIVFLSLLAGTNTMEFTKVLVFPGIITVELRPCSMTLFVSCLDACLYKIEEWKWKLTLRGLLQLEWRYCWPFVSLLIYSIQEGRMETGEGLMKGAHWTARFACQSYCAYFLWWFAVSWCPRPWLPDTPQQYWVIRGCSQTNMQITLTWWLLCPFLLLCIECLMQWVLNFLSSASFTIVHALILVSSGSKWWQAFSWLIWMLTEACEASC